MEVQGNLNTEIKWNFHLGMNIRTDRLSLGLHKKGSTYDILTADHCRLVHPDMNKILRCVLDFFTELGAVHYRKMQHTGYLRHLLLRTRRIQQERFWCTVITTSQAEHDLCSASEQDFWHLPLEGRIVGIMHIINDSLSDVVQSDETRLLVRTGLLLRGTVWD